MSNSPDPFSNYLPDTQEQARAAMQGEQDNNPFDPAEWLRLEGNKRISQDMLDALGSSLFTPFRLAQVARAYGLPYAEAEKLASMFAEKAQIKDVEALAFTEMVEAYDKIQRIVDPGLKAWKLQDLARRYHRSPKQLDEAYLQALQNQAPVAPKSASDFCGVEHVGVQWLVNGWIPRGVVIILHAAGGSGKSLLGYDLVRSVCEGSEWLGAAASIGRCLILQNDEPEVVTRDRLRTLEIDASPNLFIQTDWTIAGLPSLCQFVESSKLDLVMIDSLTSINKDSKVSENDVEFARPILQLQKLADETQTTFLVIHHSSHRGTMRGSTAIHNAGSEIWRLASDFGVNTRVLEVQKNRIGKQVGRYLLDCDWTSYRFECRSEADAVQTERCSKEKLRLFLSSDHPGIPYTCLDLAGELRLPEGSVRRSLLELYQEEVLSREKSKKLNKLIYWYGSLHLDYVDHLRDSEADDPECDRKGDHRQKSQPD